MLVYCFLFLQTQGHQMLLFTSNSKKLLIFIFIFLLLFIGFNLVIIIFKPSMSEFQNQWQRNISRVEDFLYKESQEEVIVGSSMAFNLNKDLLKQSRIFNLSFAGSSVLSGLEIIKRSKRIPKVIYVETNVIFRELIKIL